jgi:hypothetical protein
MPFPITNDGLIKQIDAAMNYIESKEANPQLKWNYLQRLDQYVHLYLSVSNGKLLYLPSSKRQVLREAYRGPNPVALWRSFKETLKVIIDHSPDLRALMAEYEVFTINQHKLKFDAVFYRYRKSLRN